MNLVRDATFLNNVIIIPIKINRAVVCVFNPNSNKINSVTITMSDSGHLRNNGMYSEIALITESVSGNNIMAPWAFMKMAKQLPSSSTTQDESCMLSSDILSYCPLVFAAVASVLILFLLSSCCALIKSDILIPSSVFPPAMSRSKRVGRV